MSTKDRILELFETSRGTYFSGEEIAKKLSVSRSAVWKAVKALQNAGYPIDAVTNKGYCLSDTTDILSPQGIKKYLAPELSDAEIRVLPEADSTNEIVREKANSGAGEGFVVIANEQTAGRGRLGRSFFSPADTGIYMSILLRPEKFSPEHSVRITTMAAVAVCEAIEAVSGEKAEIKWVNDIFMRGRKVCGILTTGSFDMELGVIDYAVLGIGINVYEPEKGFPEELKEIAGSVFTSHRSDVKNLLAAEILNRFYRYYSDSGNTAYVEKYRSRSFVIGREVRVISGNETKKALVTGIDDECHLLLKYPDGTEGCASSGEISIRV